MYSPSVLFKDGLMLYVFEILKLKGIFYFEEKKLWNAWNLDFNLHMFLDI